MPSYVELNFTDEHVEDIDFSDDADLIAMSVMLSCQIQRAWDIADKFRLLGKKVIFGGIATHLHAEETMQHADSVFLGEVEGRLEAVLNDFKRGELKKVYDYHQNHPDINLVGPAKRSILKRNFYQFRGVQMVDLFHASRGCRFNCFPCCTAFLGGRKFRPRPIEKVVEELSQIENNRLFIVDNSLAQDKQWLKELFTAMIPLKKKWVSHSILNDDEVIDLAAQAGCWYVYQAVVDRSEYIRGVVKRLKSYGIGVEGTVILGTDDHDVDEIKRFIDFLLEIDLDLAEFTIMTPFNHSPIREKMEKEGRILHNDWKHYTAGEVVFQPVKMTVDELQQMYDYAWKTFYEKSSLEIQMAKLYLKVIEKEKADGTYQKYDLHNQSAWGRKVKRRIHS